MLRLEIQVAAMRIGTLFAIILALLIGIKTAIADVTYSDFPIKRTGITCAQATAVTSHCIVPLNGVRYPAVAALHINDNTAWLYSGTGIWDTTERITAMCLSHYES